MVEQPGTDAGTQPARVASGERATLLAEVTVSLLRRIYWFFVVAQPIGIVLAVLALALDIHSRNQSRLIAAWDSVAKSAPGNSGKVAALEYLNGRSWFGLGGRRASLSGISLAPPDGAPHTDIRNVNLRGADLNGAVLDRVNAHGADFSDAFLGDAHLTNSTFGMGNFEDAVIWLTDFSGSHLGPLLGAFGGERSAIRTEDAKFFHASFQDREVRISGERTIFEGVEVSGAQIRYYRREPDEKPRGWVWARADNPAQHIPGTLLYFECDPAGVTEAVDGSGRNAGFLMPQVEQRVGRYRGALPERTTYPPISYLEYAMGYVAIVPSSAECVLKPAPKSNDGGATLMSTGTP